MEKKKLALFDLDGTLFDTKDVNYRAYSYALEKCGVHSAIDYDYYCKFCNGNNYRVFIPKIVPDISEELMQRIHSEKKQAYKNYLSYARKNEHLFSFIELIKNEYTVAVVTTASKKNTCDLLDAFGVMDCFEFLITQEDVKKTKPSPECYIQAMERTGISAEDTLIFEDSETGIKAAESSGAHYVRIYGFN